MTYQLTDADKAAISDLNRMTERNSAIALMTQRSLVTLIAALTAPEPDADPDRTLTLAEIAARKAAKS